LSVLRQISRRVLQRIFTEEKMRLRDMIRVLPRESIPAIDNPIFDNSDEVFGIRDTERVLGLQIHGDCRVYPFSILSVHQVVNDVVGGVPVAVTWCPLSYSAVVYRRDIGGRPLTFGVSGSILRNVMVIYDRETGSYWNQMTGDCFNGALSGITLQAVPLLHTTWEQWSSVCPDSRVLSKKKSPYGHYEEDHMGDYYRSGKTGIRQPTHRDHRLPEKEIILGVPAKPARVYPFTLLEAARVLHDQMDNESVVAFFLPESHTAALFRAEIDGYVLSFFEAGGSYFDYRTGSCWSPVNGLAISGPLQGKQLQPVVSLTAFWFAWADHFPKTEVYSLPGIQ
jgi:hypothetical protein